MKLPILSCFLFVLTLSVNANSESIDNYQYESKMPMHVVYPRPDCETEVFARHRLAHTKMLYNIPIGVQGGAWPFTYKLIEGPIGASIGEKLGDEYYGVVSWQPAPTDSGSKNFRIRVRDKVGNNIDLTWSVKIDNNQFVFIQDEYTGEQKGTIEKPLEDFDDWYKYDREDNSYHNKVVVFRSGKYRLIGSPKNNGNVRLDSATKSRSLIGYPSEDVIIDSSEAKIFTDNRSSEGLFVANINFINSRQDVNNAHFFWAVGDVSNSTWWSNKFFNHGSGREGNDNPAGVFIADTSHHKKNILYKDNLHDNFNNGLANGSYVDIYYSSYVLIEGNVASNSNNKCGYWAKGTTSFVSIRNNQAIENITSGGICIGYGKETKKLPNNHEVAWNKIAFNGKDKSANTILFASENGWIGKHYNSYIYRNTFVNGNFNVRFPGKEKYFLDANVIVSDKEVNKKIMKISFPNLIGKKEDFITDFKGNLSGYAKEFEGKVGAEILFK